MKTNASIVLVLGADRQFAMPLAVTLYSALVNLDGASQVTVYILDGGMDDVARLRLRKLVERARPDVRLEFASPDPRRLEAFDLRTEGRFSPAVFLRLFISELLPENCEKAIYLDSDTIVEKDLTELWRTDVGEHALLAVKERNVGSPHGLHNWRELGLAADAPYFNSGILVVNLRRWRRDRITDEVLRYLSRHRDDLNSPHEQEGLNAVLAGRWGTLDMRWNVTYPFYDSARFEKLPFADELRDRRSGVVRDPYIIHFNTAEKPWHPACTHPARSRFYAYLKQSRWFGHGEYVRWRVRLLPSRSVAMLRYAAKQVSRRLRRAAPSSSADEMARRTSGRPAASQPEATVVLVLAADEAFAMPLAVTLYSALLNLNDACRPLVYVVDAGLSAASCRRIREIALQAHPHAKLQIVKSKGADLSTYALKMEPRFSNSIFLRLLIAELLPDDLEKAIYLDSDMIVENDLSHLWNTDIGENALLAVQDLAIPYVSSTPRGLYNWRELGLSHDTPYFNSGLLVLNLQLWREERLGEAILSYLSTHRDRLNMHGNQEGFNAVLARRWGKLDPRWNLIHHAYDPVLFDKIEARQTVGITRAELTRTPYVIHFTARRKPWEPDCVHPERDRFFDYLKQSGWFTRSEYLRVRTRLFPRQFAARVRHVAKSNRRRWKQIPGSIIHHGSP